MACLSMKRLYGFIGSTTLANADLSLPDTAVVFNTATCLWRPHTHTHTHTDTQCWLCVGLEVILNMKGALEHKQNILRACTSFTQIT